MERKFKVGDKVIGNADAVLSYSYIEKDSVYEIEYISQRGNLKFSNLEYMNYNPEYFELVEAEKQSTPNTKILTLPTDSEARKEIPAFSGCVKYFPAAIAGVAKISKAGNDKHNPGQELHHDRSKSLDHSDCILRHLMDTEDLIAALNRGEIQSHEQILAEVSALAWRALAYSQTLHEKYDGAPLAPGAKENK